MGREVSSQSHPSTHEEGTEAILGEGYCLRNKREREISNCACSLAAQKSTEQQCKAAEVRSPSKPERESNASARWPRQLPTATLPR